MSAMCCPYHHLGGTPEARCARLAPDGSVWEVIDPPARCQSCGRVTTSGEAPSYAGDLVADAARAVGWSGACDPAGYLAAWRQCAADTGTSAVLVPRTHARSLDAAQIRLVRVGLDINQVEMGSLFGVGFRSVSRWETGGCGPRPSRMRCWSGWRARSPTRVSQRCCSNILPWSCSRFSWRGRSSRTACGDD